MVISDEVEDDIPGPSKVLCPICHEEFKSDRIEYHADNCAIERYSRHVHITETIQEPQDELYDGSSDEQEEIDINDFETIRAKVKSVCTKLQLHGYGTDTVNLFIFRGSCFLDFHSYFSKSWNLKKIGKQYAIKFAGEDGIDDGGVSREFYSGIYIYTVYILH